MARSSQSFLSPSKSIWTTWECFLLILSESEVDAVVGVMIPTPLLHKLRLPSLESFVVMLPGFVESLLVPSRRVQGVECVGVD